MSIAAVVASGCCCDTTCDCSAYATLTVSWDGSITFFAECVEGVCVDSESWSCAATTVSGFSVTVTRVEGKGYCSYEGQQIVGTVTMVNCDDATEFTMDVTAIAEVYWNAFFSRWEVRLILSIGPTALASPFCGGSGEWYYLDLFAYAPSANPTYPECPRLDDYTLHPTANCYPESTILYPICESGDGTCCSFGMPNVSAYTAGTITVAS